MSRQYFREPIAPIMTADQSAVTGTAEAALWPVAPWTSFVAYQLQPGQIYEIEAIGQITTAASPGTMTLTPRWGTSTAGTSFGASPASATMSGSLTSVAWNLRCKLFCRTVGSGGTTILGGALLTSALAAPVVFGGAEPTIDTTTAQGLWMGVTLGSASDSMTTQLVTVEIVN